MLSQEVINQHHSDDVQISFVLFDEIEKASDSLWNLLLGILDKASLTLGDNRRVDFSRAMIFMTSNLGASEMGELMAPKLGFRAQRIEGRAEPDEKLASRMTEVGVQAARRKFTPEFINRIDKIAVFRPLGQAELRSILNLELRQVQQRILSTPAEKPFVFRASEKARTYLLSQGTDMKYGARHLKRAIERLVVHPLSNLIATEQVSAGDWIELNFDSERQALIFEKIGEGLAFETMMSLIDGGVLSQSAAAQAA